MLRTWRITASYPLVSPTDGISPPMPVLRFVDEHNFSGKTIASFRTHGTDGLSNTIRELTAAFPEDGNMLDAIGICRPSHTRVDHGIRLGEPPNKSPRTSIESVLPWTFEQEVLTMPHIAITMIPGRDEETKQALARKTQAFLVEELGIDPKFVSVFIQDIPKEEWAESMKQFPDEIMFVKPGV